MLLVHWERRAASRADWTGGRSKAIRTAMIAITTSSSIRVKPFEARSRNDAFVMVLPLDQWSRTKTTDDGELHNRDVSGILRKVKREDGWVLAPHELAPGLRFA